MFQKQCQSLKSFSKKIAQRQQVPDFYLDAPNVSSDSEVMVALLNMGGPKTNKDVKAFLERLFQDDLLIRFPLSKILQPIFAWLIVTLRWKKTAQRYQKIGGGSPIYAATERQRKALDQELKARGRNFSVVISFNYSEPLPEQTIQVIKAAGKSVLLPISLYPHYSRATTESNLHHLKKAADQIYPELKFLKPPSYYLHEGFIQSYVDRIREEIVVAKGESLDDFYLLFSAHGLPLYFLTEGDLYPFQIAQSVALILDRINRKDRWLISYQSSVGPMQWMKPSTDEVLQAMAKNGIKKVLVVPVAFVSDHIESLCEIDMEYRQLAEEAGIHDFRMSKAPECHPLFIKALADAVEQSLPPKFTATESFVEGRASLSKKEELKHVQ